MCAGTPGGERPVRLCPPTAKQLAESCALSLCGGRSAVQPSYNQHTPLTPYSIHSNHEKHTDDGKGGEEEECASVRAPPLSAAAASVD